MSATNTSAPPSQTEKLSMLDNMEKYLDSLENAPKPWFLSTSVVYKTVKDSISALPVSREVFEKGVTAVSTVANYINDKTRAGIQVMDIDKAYELLDHLDGVLADQFVTMDDGLDHLRGKMSVSLRQLVGSIVEHKEFLEKMASEKAEYARSHAQTRYEQVIELLQNLLQAVKERYPETYDQTMNLCGQVTNKAEEYKNAVDNIVTGSYKAVHNRAVSNYELAVSKVVETQSFILKTAQPYVQDVVSRSQPLIAKAQPYVDPLVVRAKPYLEPVQETLQENRLVGPYVKSAVATANVVLEDAKSYCGLKAEDEPQSPKVEVAAH